ncbi:MAG: HAD family hydrolase [Hungatella sp.]
MDIKLVISDIDGTLIDNTEQIPTELIQMVARCRASGILFTFATGRTKELTQNIVRTLNVVDPYVIANGACIFQGERCLKSHGFSAYPILDIIKRADQNGLTVTLSNETVERAIRTTDYVRDQQKHGSRFQSLLDVHAMNWEKEQFQKIMLMDEHRTGQIKQFQEELKNYSDIYWVTTYSDMAVELGPKDCNKATGLKDLIQILNLEMKQVMACGDFLNDLEMIEEAGIGVAVGNANNTLKKAADYVAKREYCYGVIEAVEKYCF